MYCGMLMLIMNIYECKWFFSYQAAVSHIPHFGDATTSPAGDATSPAGDVDVSAGDAHL
jgi:hypothetical protein